MAPPGPMADLQTGGSTRAGSQIEMTIRAAHTALANCGVQMSPRKVNRIVRRFERNAKANGLTFHQFLTDEANLSPEQRRRIVGNPDLARVFDYRDDPTGEMAVNNVLRQLGSSGDIQ